MDLSHNQFKEFPTLYTEYLLLSTLDMSNNQISHLSEESFKYMPNLRILDFSQNAISHWADISPNTLLRGTDSIKSLNLAGNSLTSFTSIDESYILASPSLNHLDLSENRITKVTGQLVLHGILFERKNIKIFKNLKQ